MPIVAIVCARECRGTSSTRKRILHVTEFCLLKFRETVKFYVYMSKLERESKIQRLYDYKDYTILFNIIKTMQFCLILEIPTCIERNKI